MKKVGFWQAVWGDINYYERRKLNEAAESIDLLKDSTVAQTNQVARLFALDQAQSLELERLRLTIKVLTEILIDSGAVDEKVLHYRIEAAVDEADAARRDAQAAAARERVDDPMSLADVFQPPPPEVAAEPAAEEPMVRCMTCSESVPKRTTTIMTGGVACKRCHELYQTFGRR